LRVAVNLGFTPVAETLRKAGAKEKPSRWPAPWTAASQRARPESGKWLRNGGPVGSIDASEWLARGYMQATNSCRRKRPSLSRFDA